MEQKTGYMVNAKLSGKEQLRPALPEASLKEKLKEKKQRLEKLVLLKNDVGREQFASFQSLFLFVWRGT